MDAPVPINQGLQPPKGLIYVSDTDPGYRRRRAGKGFCYVKPDGTHVKAGPCLSRIKTLSIPPAWKDVWICSNSSGHLQATGRDQEGRKQYIYHEEWTSYRDEQKFGNLTHFAKSLPALREQMKHDLRCQGLSRNRVLASIVWLLDCTLMRIGNESYVKQNKSYGLTTLRSRHVKVEGDEMRFSYTGKSGKRWKLKLNDRRMAKLILSVQQIPGQHLFQYLQGTEKYEIRSQDVNEYISSATGEDFTSKDFRTWGATVTTALSLEKTTLPDSTREKARTLNAAIDTAARLLCNTRTVCRRSYIHPAVITAWQRGQLPPEMNAIRRNAGFAVKGLKEGEALVLSWLSKHGTPSPSAR
jgi:DNA topoisomerase-1